MNINIIAINERERPTLESLMQLYLKELNIYFKTPYDINENKYFYDLDKYFGQNYAYFIKEDNEILGFVLIDDHENNNYEISEFFVLNEYKNKHIGETVANIVFNKYRGNWVVKVVPLTSSAELFWKKVIDRYTSGDYKEIYTGKYNRPEFYFNNSI